jgi:hypothetical protein
MNRNFFQLKERSLNLWAINLILGKNNESFFLYKFDYFMHENQTLYSAQYYRYL